MTLDMPKTVSTVLWQCLEDICIIIAMILDVLAIPNILINTKFVRYCESIINYYFQRGKKILAAAWKGVYTVFWQ